MNVLDDPIVLKLNSAWMRIGFCTPRQAFVSLCGGMDGGSPPALALDIYLDSAGELVDAIPTSWSRWINLPLRHNDIPIGIKDRLIRCPSVLISPVYSGMPKRGRKLTGKALRERDKGICQVSGRPLKEGEGNMGHIIARAKGGSRTWENLVYMDKALNTLQGTRTPEEMGWTLRSIPGRPSPLPVALTPTEAKLPDHTPFI